MKRIKDALDQAVSVNEFRELAIKKEALQNMSKKRRITLLILSILCATALVSGALAEDSATVTVNGVGEHVTVTLTMEDDRIISVEASTDNTEADERGRASLELISSAMIEKNSVNVDAISGATCTSNAVIAGATEAWLHIMTERMSQEDWMQAAETPPSGVQSIIEEIVTFYGQYGDEAEEQINALLADLEVVDPKAHAQWAAIMGLWKEEPVVNEGILPDGFPETDELCLVALGFQLNPDGTMREELIERLKVVLASSRKYPNARIVCTGGGTAADNPNATEAGMMAQWLIDNGVDADRVIVEDHSLTTAQNAIYTFDILEKQYPQVRQLAILSSDYHIATGALLFGAEAILRDSDIHVVSNAACKAPTGTLSTMFQAGALIELSGDVETAFEIYYETYDIHELPALDTGTQISAKYGLNSVHPVAGRQGICAEGNYYWVSGSTTLTKYDRDWNVVAQNTDPFKGYSLEINHIGDIDVCQNELYLGVELFINGAGSNIQVAVYDGDTLELKRVFPFKADTGQLECSGIAVDPDSRTVYMSSWIDDESSNCLYIYDLDTGEYRGKVTMRPAPKWIQGVACHDGALYITCDDGDADSDAPDSMYRVEIVDDFAEVSLERSFDDVVRQGEIEGLSFDEEHRQFLLLYNRGARIKLGMPVGYYDGYTEEMHEVYVYDMWE